MLKQATADFCSLHTTPIKQGRVTGRKEQLGLPGSSLEGGSGLQRAN